MYRALSQISNYPQHFQAWQDLPILAYDPTFIMPMLVMAMNYQLIKVSFQV